jgi:hypothetical protein
LDRKWTNIIIWPRDRASISVQQLRISLSIPPQLCTLAIYFFGFLNVAKKGKLIACLSGKIFFGLRVQYSASNAILALEYTNRTIRFFNNSSLAGVELFLKKTAFEAFLRPCNAAVTPRTTLAQFFFTTRALPKQSVKIIQNYCEP